jgi:hypothetical protein
MQPSVQHAPVAHQHCANGDNQDVQQKLSVKMNFSLLVRRYTHGLEPRRDVNDKKEHDTQAPQIHQLDPPDGMQHRWRTVICQRDT